MKKLIRVFKRLTFFLLVPVLFVIGLDLSLHAILKDRGGYNYKGYRGDVFTSFAPVKIACFGGSTTFGFGVAYDQTWPYFLEKELNEDASVANLGMHGQGLYGIRYDIDYFDHLDYDVAVIYNGYNDLYPDSLQEFSLRKHDIIFDKTGYKPIIADYFYDQILLREKPNEEENSVVFSHTLPDSIRQLVLKHISDRAYLAEHF